MNKSQRLPVEQQDSLIESWKHLSSDKQAELINQNVMSGVFDTMPVIKLRKVMREFVTTDPTMLKLRDKAVTLATRNEPVLVLGESGTGKELIAKILHGARHGEFVAVNVCAVTDTLFESELFGHVRGSFTGADKDRDGLVYAARGGTLFLDEIGDMPLHLQAKILRMIQHRTYRQVGSNVDRYVEARIVAATHRDLRSMILKQQFRLDLYERLNVFSLKLLPLRERLGDVASYVPKEFAMHMVDLLQKAALNPDYLQYQLLSGNVRQLMNVKLRWEVFGELPTVEDIL